MAEIKSFPNNQDVYVGAEWVMKWLHGRTSGVFGAENNLSTSVVPDSMSVEVSDGVGWLSNDKGDGIVFWNDSEQSSGSKLRLTHDVADGVLDRIDRIVVTWETTNYVALPTISVLKGTASSNPVAPALTNNNIQRQISLAKVSIPAGTVSLLPLMITDERLDNAVCGIVTEQVTADTSMINAQYRSAVAQLETAIQEAWDGEISVGAVTAEKIADDAVTGDKIAQGAICVGAASFTLSTADWTLNDKGVYEQEKTTTLGVAPEKHIGFLGLTRGLLHYPGDGNTTWGWSQSLIESDREKIACLYSASLIAINTIKFVATEIPDGTLYVTILFFRR